jgi:hypothetical protein
MSKQSQIFQTVTKTRWQRFKWAFRLLLFLSLFGLTALAIAVTSLSVQNIPLDSRAIKKVLSGDIPAYRQSPLGKQYRGFKKAMDVRWSKRKRDSHGDSLPDLSRSPLFSDSVGIRAGFYVTWDPQSFFSLEQNISKLNLVIPEWFFIDPVADTLFTNIDKKH